MRGGEEEGPLALAFFPCMALTLPYATGDFCSVSPPHVSPVPFA